MHTLLKASAAAALLAATAACASRPPPVDDTPVTPPPVEEPVTETETVVTEPVVESSIKPGSLEDFRVNVGERVYFDLDQWSLDSDDQEILKRQAAWLQAYPNVRVLVAGNADERGTREYNLALGERRASAAKDYLVSLGVSASRVDTVSYGKERPIAGGSNDESWALNRNSWTQIVSGATS
ncbi:peptidoglycan-associated lipoprotein Pal [Hyphomonas sp. WL0036]|uniref:peptidoglycan-associated lipoprotein Pal n=1 Tax=Hyphomonas sediminis TaxID=2866160 RepID=UPI001C81EDAB|nr:peptidoglycan-associated lipoprotein Pal [Hyphomonas sediminis]MBY9066187.1 peptidoglycan-associated lipoprotein Pal [Hyphomonas sediminis]